MRSIPASLIFVLVCHCTRSQATLSDTNAPGSLQFIFNEGYCPKLKLYNGEALKVGCFDSVLGFKPLKPKYINPTYSLYKSDNASRCVRQWRYDEPLGNEADGILGPDSYLSVIIHGFQDADSADWMIDMKNAILKLPEPEKRAVILLDWSEGAEGPNYARAASNIVMLGRVTAEFLNRLTKRFNLDTDKMHLIGHSLGGQTVGQITKWWNEKYGVRVGRATGLDVAAPLFEERSMWPDKEDSKFLEGIHTSSGPSPVTGDLGLTVNFAHVDVYPNGGKAAQPECPIVALDVSCSHNMARTFYTDFLRSCASGCRYPARLCRSVACAEDAACEGRSLNLCDHIQISLQQEIKVNNQIVFIDTTSEEYKNRCSNGNTTDSD